MIQDMDRRGISEDKYLLMSERVQGGVEYKIGNNTVSIPNDIVTNIAFPVLVNKIGVDIVTPTDNYTTFTTLEAGGYIIFVSARINYAAPSRRTIGIAVNDISYEVTQVMSITTSGGTTQLSASGFHILEAGDKISGICWQDSGTTVTLPGSSPQGSRISIVKLF